MNRAEVWLAALDPVRGSEQAGTRPVLILQSDALNAFLRTLSRWSRLCARRRRFDREAPITPQPRPIEIRDWDYDGMPIARGYILTARPTPEAVATPNAAAAG